MSTNIKNFSIFNSDTPVADTILSTSDVLEVVIEANIYIIHLSNLFKEKNLDFFEVLGQRNLSGLVGEIFSRFFCKKFNPFVNNPHPDGRPDIIYLANKEIEDYYYKECFISSSKPIKSKLSPFPYDGIEVKCTIGNHKNNYNRQLEIETGSKVFDIGIPRINYLSDLVWWAHHTHSKSLIGLYYDYYSEENYAPQILAVFYSNLNKNDWTNLSVGKANSKKTSNTSLNKEGKEKMKQNCLLTINNELYIDKFIEIGIPLLQNIPNPLI